MRQLTGAAPIVGSLADRRTVAGLDLPYRVTTARGTETIDDLVFDEILVNPEIGKADFES